MCSKHLIILVSTSLFAQSQSQAASYKVTPTEFLDLVNQIGNMKKLGSVSTVGSVFCVRFRKNVGPLIGQNDGLTQHPFRVVTFTSMTMSRFGWVTMTSWLDEHQRSIKPGVIDVKPPSFLCLSKADVRAGLTGSTHQVPFGSPQILYLYYRHSDEVTQISAQFGLAEKSCAQGFEVEQIATHPLSLN